MVKKSIYKDLDETLLPWITMSNKLFADIISYTFRKNDIDLSREQMIVLKHLNDEDGRVQNDLAFVTNRDKTSLTRLISNMEKKGLITRVKCKEDQRRNKICMTDKGASYFKKAFPLVKKVAHQMQENISQEEIQQTIKTLNQVFNNLSVLHNEKK
jgi:DNA-binding MarR family transcriptional regulator